MRHSQIKAFHYVALLGGFSRAAEDLGLTQPAISEQVRNLEQDHDVLLFRRERKQVHLTDAGERLFLLTKQYFEIEQRMAEDLTRHRDALQGELRIIADSAYHVTDILHRFRQKFPKVTVSLRSGNTDEILAELRAYNAEIGVVGSIAPHNDLFAKDLGSSAIVAFAQKGMCRNAQSGMAIRTIADFPLIFREQGSKTRTQVVEAAKKQGVALHPAVVAEGREAVREMVLSGAGIGFVSEAEFGNDDRLEIIQITDLDVEMSESIVHLNARNDVRLIRAFMDAIDP